MKHLSPYEQFQLDHYGNILPEQKTIFCKINQETENGSYQADEDARRDNMTEELDLIKQESI